MNTLKVRGEYITLGQVLKAAGLVENGAESKEVIQAGEVMVDGETETPRQEAARRRDRAV